MKKSKVAALLDVLASPGEVGGRAGDGDVTTSAQVSKNREEGGRVVAQGEGVGGLGF